MLPPADPNPISTGIVVVFFTLGVTLFQEWIVQLGVALIASRCITIGTFSLLGTWLLSCVVRPRLPVTTTQSQASPIPSLLPISVLNAVADPIFVKDRDHRWVLLNDAFCALFSEKRENLIGKTDYNKFPQEQADVFWQKDNEVFLTGRVNENEELFTDARGITHTIVTRKSRYYDQNGNVFLVGSIRDITDKKLAEQQKIRLIAEQQIRAALEREKEAAESASRMKSEFLDIAAHELKTPLTSLTLLMQSALKFYRQNTTPPETYLEKASRQITRLTGLVDDLLNAARLDRGGFILHLIECNLSKVIRDCVEDAQHREPSRTILFHDAPGVICCQADPERICQVLSNLIDNALKYAANESPIEVTLKVSDHRARVEVTDHGPGIPLELQAQLFTRFYRANLDANLQHPGLGLGLYISKKIIDLHGGMIGVKSQVNQGATFFFELKSEENSP